MLVDGVQGVGKTQHGVLTRSADHDVSFGIPSFHDFMCAKAKAIEEQRAREAQGADSNVGGR